MSDKVFGAILGVIAVMVIVLMLIISRIWLSDDIRQPCQLQGSCVVYGSKVAALFYCYREPKK